MPEGVTLGRSCEHSCVFFSAYVEGASYDKALEIVNKCEGDVRLGDDYELVSCWNGCDTEGKPAYHTVTLLDEAAVLPSGARWRIADPRARLPSNYPANQTWGHNLS